MTLDRMKINHLAIFKQTGLQAFIRKPKLRCLFIFQTRLFVKLKMGIQKEKIHCLIKEGTPRWSVCMKYVAANLVVEREY